jgi:hypothetical protein
MIIIMNKSFHFWNLYHVNILFTSYIIIIAQCFNSSSSNFFIKNIRKYCTQILYHQTYEEHKNFMIANSIYYNYLFAKTFSTKRILPM